MTNSKKIYIWVSLLSKNHLVGTLWFHNKKARESASFEYDQSWLNHPEKFALEPALFLTSGTFHTNQNQKLFGALGDSAPDRWGRILMRRHNSQQAKLKNSLPHTLTEIDYLLGVNDITRQGALRFSETIDGEFLNKKEQNSIPPLIDLPKLLSSAEKFMNSDDTEQDLKLLLAPGSSLGGARPKASITYKNGNLAIAKFPRRDDEYNLVTWEAVALTLAKQAKIRVPNWELKEILNKPVLIIERFDRIKMQRIPFLSAMSMLGAKDNEEHSYLEIAYTLTTHGTNPNEDLKELWRRIIFNILISNNDDHLRNHAFLYVSQKGWQLSPIYDINPTPLELKPRILSTSINFDDNSASLDLAFSVIDEFRITKQEALQILKEVSSATKNWKSIAKKFNLSNKEINFMETAFEDHNIEKFI
jgi:serine/threonine-protein kinase HipA